MARITFLTTALLLLAGCSRESTVIDGASRVPEAQALVSVAFTEGPTVDAEGNVYFSDTASQRIVKYTPGEGLSTFREPSNRSNGLLFDGQGRLIACESAAARVTRTNMESGDEEVIAQDTPETPIDGPNDVTIDGQGRLYFTDYGGGRIYRIDPDGEVRLLLRRPAIDVPNGIIISPDDRTLYHVESNGKEGGARSIRAYDLSPEGEVSNMRIFHNFYPGRSADGLAIDTEGNVYAAAGLNRLRNSSETLDTKAGIHVFSPAGDEIGFHPIWEDTISNCAFGGEDMKTLYITAGKTLFSVRTEVAGTRR